MANGTTRCCPNNRSIVQFVYARSLNRELDTEPNSERQVVYILVEARKLLEQQSVLDKFPAFKMCCDWAVHPKLDRSGAQIVLQHIDEYESEFRKTGVAVGEFQLKPLHDFLSHNTFCSEFIQALEPYGVNVDSIRSASFWQSFIQQYSAVIQDCPLEAKRNSAQLVSHVTCIAWPEETANSIYPGKRVVEWHWSLKDGARRTVVCALI
jgi:hypothetical protein